MVGSNPVTGTPPVPFALIPLRNRILRFFRPGAAPVQDARSPVNVMHVAAMAGLSGAIFERERRCLITEKANPPETLRGLTAA